MRVGHASTYKTFKKEKVTTAKQTVHLYTPKFPVFSSRCLQPAQNTFTF